MSCAGGNQSRSRECLNGSVGETGCHEPPAEDQPCNEQACPPCEDNNGGCSDICDNPGTPDDWASPGYKVICSCEPAHFTVLDTDDKTCGNFKLFIVYECAFNNTEKRRLAYVNNFSGNQFSAA